MNIYYTYAYLREDKTPYYIGKGKQNRAYKKHSVGTPPKDRIIILKQNLTEEEAFRHEIYMISVFGRKDLATGILENKNSGGNGSSGKIYSQEDRERMRQEVFGKKWWNNGIENSHNKECPGKNWVLGRMITWDEEKRLKNLKIGASKNLYKLTNKNGEVAYCINLLELGIKCGCKNGFYRVLFGIRKSYKGWVSVEKCYNYDAVTNPQIIIDLCKKYTDKTYKITHKDGRVIYCDDLKKLGKEYGSLSGFYRIMEGIRKSYKGWISVEIL